jgi:hypothetical protein
MNWPQRLPTVKHPSHKHMTRAAAYAWMRRSWVLASTGFLMACATSPSQANPPDWVLNPPNDNMAEYWGVGEGYDLESARRTALRSVAAKLRVSVSGVMESETRVRNGGVDRTAQTKVSEVVQETEFSNVSIEKSTKYNNDVYVLVKIDRRAFIKETQAKFDSLNRSVQNELTHLDQHQAIDQFKKLTAAAPNIDKAIALAQLLRVADPAFADTPSLKNLELQQHEATNAAKRLVVRLEHDARDIDVARAVTSFLNTQGIRVSPTEPSLVLRMVSSVKEDLLFGNKSHQLNLGLQLVDGNGQTLASKQYRSNGNSLDSHVFARQDAVNQLLRSMNAAGPVAGLGL